MPGWLRPNGKLWATEPDDSFKLSLYSPRIFPNDTGLAILGIQGVRFEQSSENGTTTTFTLRRWELLSRLSSASDVPDVGAMPQVSPDMPDYQVNA